MTWLTSYVVLPDSVFKQVLQSMSKQDRVRVEQALSYPDDTAGSLMNTDTVTLRPDVNIDVILRYLRIRGELPDATDMLYVVDKHDRVLGGDKNCRSSDLRSECICA